ncbi:MAG: hypothetical protein HDT39_06010 [Lachnospiraceae bacterium]|nr:hypothetical protein [Lachnospiraceae bacterium]
MNLKSKNFIVRKLNENDKEVLKELEYTRPWAKGMLEKVEDIKCNAVEHDDVLTILKNCGNRTLNLNIFG